MDVEIMKKDGSKYRLSDFGVVYDFVVGSIRMENYDDSVVGRHGKLDFGSNYIDRVIKVPMKFKHGEMHNYAHLRDELYGVLTDVESYYIREMRRPRRLEYEFIDFGQTPKWKEQTENEYVDGKQFLVRMTSELEPEQLYNGGEIEIEFTTTELPFAETIYTTKYLNDFGFREAQNKFGVAENINQDYTKSVYTTTYFEVWNGGNVTVEPEVMELNIELLNAVTSGFRIVNKSTNEEFRYTGRLNYSTLLINGVQVHTGVINRLRDTSRTFISLKPGINQIEITGVSYDQISFDFKYYYK